jgi:DNA-binding transcriptional MerR regulator/methylmalonyl-CoA mutase cobalamin-binding subunit
MFIATAPMTSGSNRPHDAYPVRTVVRLTGLSADIIRAWERRYGVVAPIRGPRGARLYTAADVSHLRLLARVVDSGRAIGDVAGLSSAELEALASSQQPQSETNGALQPALAGPAAVVEHVLAAIERFDMVQIERLLSDSLVAMSSGPFARSVVAPLLTEVGQRWSAGQLTVADEHLLTGVLRNLLSGLIRSRTTTAQPHVLLATPTGERHEFGLLLVSLLLLDGGLGLRYLGIDLPAAEIVAAARRSRAAVVGLSLVDAGNRDQAAEHLRTIESSLPQTTEIWLGGRDAAFVVQQLGQTRALVLDGLETTTNELVRLRDACGTNR